MSAPDWRAILTAQGIDPAVIDQAEATAAGMAELAASVPHDPTTPVVTADLVTLLMQRRDDT